MTHLQISNLSKSFGGLKAVSDLNLQLDKGQILGLIGPNGSGKTTIFNLISGFYKPDQGRILMNGKDITGMRPDQICKLGLTRTYQAVKPFNDSTVLDNVIVGALNRTSRVNVAREKAHEIIDFLSMNSIKNITAGSLPIASQKRLEIAKALATGPDIILLDETMAGLRPVEVDELINVVQKISDSGISLIIVEHVMKVIMSLAKHIVVINYGQKIAEGTPDEIAHNPQVIEAYLGEKHKHDQDRSS